MKIIEGDITYTMCTYSVYTRKYDVKVLNDSK